MAPTKTSPSSAAASIAPLGGGPGRTRVTLVRQRLRQYQECGDPRDHVVIGLGLGNQPRAIVLSLRSDRPQSCMRVGEPPPALARSEAVTDGVGNRRALPRRPPATRSLSPVTNAAWACWPRIWVNLHWSPSARARPIASAKYRRRHLGVVDGGAAAGGECSDQQRRIVEFARDRQSLFGASSAVVVDPRSRALSCRRVPARARAGATSVEACVAAVEHGIEPGQPFLDTAARQPQRHQRRCQLQCALDVAGFDAPAECASEIVHLLVCLLDSLVVVSAGRRIEQRRHRGVVIAVT